jgi:hypothetical protein
MGLCKLYLFGTEYGLGMGFYEDKNRSFRNNAQNCLNTGAEIRNARLYGFSYLVSQFTYFSSKSSLNISPIFLNSTENNL